MSRRGDSSNYDGIITQWISIPPPPDILDKKGACVGKPQEGFFMENSSQTDPRVLEALACCARCPVRKPCLDYAMRIPWASDFGIWGGTNRNQRLKMRGRK